MSEIARPLPTPSRVSAPFWQAAREHRLVAPRCQRCGTVFFYPRHLCPECLHDAFDWPTLSGRGMVYSYTVVRQAVNPAFQADAPYVFALIELEEGIRLSSNVVGCLPEDVRIGMPVEVVFEDLSAEIALPKFRPAGG